MPRTIQARLDSESAAILERLAADFGWTRSEVVRQGIRVLASSRKGKSARSIVGLGKFTSGVPDLGSNKAHLKGFGR